MMGRRVLGCAIVAFASLGCHGPQGMRGYVFDSGGHEARVYVRDVDEERSLPHPDHRPVPGALVRVEVLGQAGGWVPFGPFAKKSETRTDGLGSFFLEWSEIPHPQDARLLVVKDGFKTFEYRFALPGYQEVRIFLARDPDRGGVR